MRAVRSCAIPMRQRAVGEALASSTIHSDVPCFRRHEVTRSVGLVARCDARREMRSLAYGSHDPISHELARSAGLLDEADEQYQAGFD